MGFYSDYCLAVVKVMFEQKILIIYFPFQQVVDANVIYNAREGRSSAEVKFSDYLLSVCC